MNAVEGSFAVTDGWVEPAVGCAGDLAGDDDAFAWLVFHPFADDFFGEACELGGGRDGIEFGGVEEVDSAFYGFIHDAKAFFFVGLGAKGHGPETNLADDDSACS